MCQLMFSPGHHGLMEYKLFDETWASERAGTYSTSPTRSICCACKILNHTEKGKINGGRKSLKKQKNLISKPQLDHVYHAHIESHVRYANVTWGSLPNTKLSTLQRLQDRACSIIYKARLKENWSCNWLTVKQLTNFDRSAMTYKIVNRQCPESLWDKYHNRTQHSNYRTGNCRDLKVSRIR